MFSILLLVVAALLLAVITRISAQTCRTTGGYASEGTPCVLPFTYVDPVTGYKKVATSCVSSSLIEAYKSNRPNRGPKEPISSTLKQSWCATKSSYARSSMTLRKNWGYCNCVQAPADENELCRTGQKDIPCAFAPKCGQLRTFNEAEQICKNMGARLCSVTEINDLDIAQNACQGKTKSEVVWTLDACIEAAKQTGLARYTVPSDGRGTKAFCKAMTKTRAGVRCCVYPKRANSKVKNVLMIIADDLRPDLKAAYGRKFGSTPAIDAFARDSRTVVMGKAYVNYAQCVPSRLSFMTGLSPDTTGPIDASTWVSRRSITDLTLPEFLRSKGFNALSGGKVFQESDSGTAELIWNSTYARYENQYTFGGGCQNPRAKPLLMKNGVRASSAFLCLMPSDPKVLIDFALVDQASTALTKAAWNPDQPFFMAVGIYKPHLPLNVPVSFFNDIGIGYPNEPVLGPQPQSSYFPFFFNYDASLLSASGARTPWGRLNPSFVGNVRRAYAAGISETDRCVGVLLGRLQQLNLENNTLVMIFGDNGFATGENGLWNKDMLFEMTVRVPLIIRVPWAVPDVNRTAGSVRRATSHYFELLDLYRTTAGLLGIVSDIPAKIEGRDFSEYIMSQLQGPRAGGPIAAKEQYAQARRCGYVDSSGKLVQTDCPDNNANVRWMGYSVRNNAYRYTVWLNVLNGVPDWSTILAQELYDHRNDASTIFNYSGGVSYEMENVNVAAANPTVVATMLELLKIRFMR